MENKTKFQQVLEALKAKGWTDEQITKLSEELATAVFNKFYTDAVANLTDEDLDELDKCNSSEEANLKIKELYKLRVGKDPDVEAAQFYEDFATKFLEEEKAA